jgi:hypothetical protein
VATATASIWTPLRAALSVRLLISGTIRRNGPFIRLTWPDFYWNMLKSTSGLRSGVRA